MPARRREDRSRNDPAQYDELVDEWWRSDGAFAMLHWLAEARARLVPPAPRADAVLVDLGCGGGLLAPHIAGRGYRHIGVDVIESGLRQAADHGVRTVRADAAAVPLADRTADVVCAGELLEHVPDPAAVVAEACRLLRPGGRLIVDTINSTWLARLLAVTVAERIGGIAIRGLHDPSLFVPPRLLVEVCARHGVRLSVRGVRPAAGHTLRWLIGRRSDAVIRRTAGRKIVPTFSTAVLYQGVGIKEPFGVPAQAPGVYAGHKG